jgi:hypothetical protein
VDSWHLLATLPVGAPHRHFLVVLLKIILAMQIEHLEHDLVYFSGIANF